MLGCGEAVVQYVQAKAGRKGTKLVALESKGVRASRVAEGDEKALVVMRGSKPDGEAKHAVDMAVSNAGYDKYMSIVTSFHEQP